MTCLAGTSDSEDYNSILPGKETTLTICAVPVRNFSRASLSENPVDSAVISTTARFSRFISYACSEMDWDMNRVIWQIAPSVGR